MGRGFWGQKNFQRPEVALRNLPNTVFFPYREKVSTDPISQNEIYGDS